MSLRSLFSLTLKPLRLDHTIAVLLLLYIFSLAVALITGGTILMAAAISLFLLNPFGIALYIQSKPDVRTRTIVRQFAPVLIYILVTSIICTLSLFIITDMWNPDKFYTDYPPPLLGKLALLFGIQRLWIMAGLLLSLIPLLLGNILRPTHSKDAVSFKNIQELDEK